MVKQWLLCYEIEGEGDTSALSPPFAYNKQQKSYNQLYFSDLEETISCLLWAVLHWYPYFVDKINEQQQHNKQQQSHNPLQLYSYIGSQGDPKGRQLEVMGQLFMSFLDFSLIFRL